jgi:two-component system OmpR family response regulator
VRVLVIEDDAGVAAALRKGLGRAGFAVDVAGSATQATTLVRTGTHDVGVLDLGLPDQDGLAWLRALRAAGDPLPVLILTARGSVRDRVTGLEAGGDDYLQKPFAFPELLARLRALLRRGTALAPTVLRVADLEMDVAAMRVQRGGQILTLTAKEFAVLEYFMRHAGTLVTRTMILDHCWDDSYEGLSNLVDVHVSRLRRKVDGVGARPLFHTIRHAGFILADRERAG